MFVLEFLSDFHLVTARWASSLRISMARRLGQASFAAARWERAWLETASPTMVAKQCNGKREFGGQSWLARPHLSLARNQKITLSIAMYIIALAACFFSNSAACAHERWILTPEQIIEWNAQPKPELFTHLSSGNITMISLFLIFVAGWVRLGFTGARELFPDLQARLASYGDHVPPHFASLLGLDAVVLRLWRGAALRHRAIHHANIVRARSPAARSRTRMGVAALGRGRHRPSHFVWRLRAVLRRAR